MGGGRRVDWVATQPPLEQPLKNIMRGKKKRKYMGHKNLVKPTSLTNAAAIDRSVVCQKFVALHP